MLFCITYASSAIKLMSKDEILELLEKSRLKNACFEITGILLYQDGNFMQVLEGEQAVVQNLYKTICQDERHRGVITLLEKPIAKRTFAEWSMGFMDLTLKPQCDLSGFSQFLMTPLRSDAFANNPDAVHVLLNVFKKNLRSAASLP